MKKEKFVIPYFWNIRDAMDRNLSELIRKQPNGKWKEGFPAPIHVLNIASHEDGKRVNELLIQNILDAYKRNTPVHIMNYVLKQAVEWRKIMLAIQPREEKTTGEISFENLKLNLRKKLPDDYLKKLFE